VAQKQQLNVRFQCTIYLYTGAEGIKENIDTKMLKA